MDLRAIAFDLFNTLVRCNHARLPRAVIGGVERPSTLPVVLRVLVDAGHSVDMARLSTAAVDVSREQEQEKLESGRELSSAHRWAAILTALDIDPEPALVKTVVAHHMGTMCAAWDINERDREALLRVSERYPVALLSNFDHGPSARQLLRRVGVADLFAYVGISDELGWRKPEERVFRSLLVALDIAPESCIYVGDSIPFDVQGAHAAGMPSAWIADQDAELPQGVEPPAMRAETVADLEPQLSRIAAA